MIAESKILLVSGTFGDVTFPNSKVKEIFESPRLKAKSIDGFIELTKNMVNSFLPKSSQVIGIFLEKYPGFSKNVSNSHSSPIGEHTNWCGRDKNYPTGFPGWNPYVRIIMSADNNDSGLVQAIPGFNTGTGGGGGYSSYKGIEGYILGYDLKLFMSDFPLIQEKCRRTMGLLTMNNF